MITKYCWRCKETKDSSLFYKDKSKKDGLNGKCKKCDKECAKSLNIQSSPTDTIIAFNNLVEMRKIKKVLRNSISNPNRDYTKIKKKHKQPLKKYKKEKHNRYLWSSAKARAKRYNIPFNLSPEDIIIPLKCPLLDVDMIFRSPFAPSLDRIIPEIGYVKGNVIVISKKANTMKNDASIDELKTFCRNVLSIL